MKSTSSKSGFDSAKALLDYGFANYKLELIAKKGDSLASIDLAKGKESELDLVLEKDVYILLKKDQAGSVDKIINIPDLIKAPVKKGSIIGELVLKVNDEEITRINLLSEKDIKRANLLDSFKTIITKYIKN